MSLAAFIADQRTTHDVPHAVACRALTVSESWFYKWNSRRHQQTPTLAEQRRTEVDAAVAEAFEASAQRCAHRPAPQRTRCPLPIRRRPGPQPTPNPRRLDTSHRRRDSREPALHPALVTEQDFIAAQQIRAARPASDGRARRFALAGLIHCGVCDRRLDSHWNHGRPTYRCCHGHISTQRASQARPKTLYIREDHLVDEISIRLGDQGNDDHDTSELDRPRHRRVAAALRDSGKIIVYDTVGWRLKEIDSS